MALVERVKNICFKPNAEWAVIAEEPSTPGELVKSYALPLAAITPIAAFIGGSLIGRTVPFIGSYRVPFATGIVLAVVTFVMSLVGVFVLSLIINALAPSFGGQKNPAQAMKVAVYSYTPAWVAGALQILPMLGVLAIIGGIYALYVLYLGLPRLMKCPPDKAIGYTVVVVLCGIVLSVVVGGISAAVAGAGMLASGGMPGLTGPGRHAPMGQVQFDKDSPLGKLQAIGQAMEESNKKMETAQKSGNPNAQAKAAMEGLGTLFGGGKHVEPIGIDQLKPFVPDTFAGLPKLGGSAEKNGMAGLSVSKAEGSYGDHAQKHITLEISESGGASGLLGLAGWMAVQGEREDDSGTERTQNVDGRLVHEKSSKRGGPNEFTIVLGNRFVVSAKGNGVELGDLKAAVSGLALGKLEAMKDVGVQK